MTLAGLLRECPDRLEADLCRFFPGVSLAAMWSGQIPISTVAACAAHLPPGGAVGQFYGGWLAVSDEVAMLMNINYTIAVTSTDKPKRVPKPKPPVGVRDMERKEAHAATMAEKFRRKHRGRRDEERQGSVEDGRIEQADAVGSGAGGSE